MKTIKPILLLAISFLILACTQLNKGRELDEVEQFATNVFEALQEKQAREFKKFIPERDIFQKLGDQQFRERMDKEYPKMERQILGGYFMTRKTAEEKGIDLKKAKIKEIEYETKERVLVQDTVVNADIELTFTVKNVPYKIKMENCARPFDKWYLGSKIEWIGIQPYKID